MKFDSLGREVPDTTPVQRTVEIETAISRHRQMQEFIRREMSRIAAAQGEESFEEADDFEVDEDPEMLSAYEIPDAPVEWLGGVKDEDAAPPLDPSRKNDPRASGAVAAGVSTAGSPGVAVAGSGNGGASGVAAASPTGKPGDVGSAQRS